MDLVLLATGPAGAEAPETDPLGRTTISAGAPGAGEFSAQSSEPSMARRGVTWPSPASAGCLRGPVKPVTIANAILHASIGGGRLGSLRGCRLGLGFARVGDRRSRSLVGAPGSRRRRGSIGLLVRLRSGRLSVSRLRCLRHHFSRSSRRRRRTDRSQFSDLRLRRSAAATPGGTAASRASRNHGVGTLLDATKVRAMQRRPGSHRFANCLDRGRVGTHHERPGTNSPETSRRNADPFPASGPCSEDLVAPDHHEGHQ
ncbi:MAG TPA: hypothetical protein VFI65_08920 [Streptosporangiaceae bacterium]|nr:hypothetical protein [Streptosporangiaceae bacterium]